MYLNATHEPDRRLKSTSHFLHGPKDTPITQIWNSQINKQIYIYIIGGY